MSLIKKLAYKIVYKDLKKVNLFMGKYDATNGSEKFMYGINTVMEFITYESSDKDYDEFQSIFFKNMDNSQQRIKN